MIAAAKESIPALSSVQMACPAFPVAPHEFFRRPLAEAPHEKSTAPSSEKLQLSDLEMICHLGAGARGVVTKVRHRRTGALFALKTAHYPDGETDEAEALRRSAGSPHVVRCHAVQRRGTDEDVLVLELMDAGTLAGVVSRRGRGLSEPALAEVAARCLEGLAHLHARGVAHLDLNPDNLLVSSDGDVKIADLSESKIFHGGAGNGRRRVSIAVGKTAYKSPERFAPNAHAGPRGAAAADVWGLGITVLELFLGRSPLFPPSMMMRYPPYEKMREAICDAEPPSVPETMEVSAELRGFVAACLRKDPRQRATASQLLAHPFVARRHVEESRRALRELIVEEEEK